MGKARGLFATAIVRPKACVLTNDFGQWAHFFKKEIG